MTSGLRATLILSAASVIATTSLSQAQVVTAEQISVCYPEAVRLCAAPKNGEMSEWRKARVIACMLHRLGQISDACKNAFGATSDARH